MDRCIAITAKGIQCVRHGRHEFEGPYCLTHFQKKLDTDAGFRARHEAHLAAEEAAAEVRRQERLQEEAARQAALEAQRNAEELRAAERTARQREQKIRKNTKLVEEAHLLSPNDILHYARTLMTMWSDVPSVPGFEFPTAYLCIKFKTSTHVGFPELMRCVVRIVRQGNGHHPIHTLYTFVPEEERVAAINLLRQALIPYGEMTNRQLLEAMPVGDHFRSVIRNRIHALEADQLQQNLLHNPVVFQRDPDGSINLQAFAQDNQSVHRSSVQNATHRAALSLLERPLLPGQDTLPEILEDFNRDGYVRWIGRQSKDLAITEITNDYFTTEAFSLRYSDVLDRVWAYIKVHANKQDLVLRLAQEVCEGIRMCTNGKMARLINVLQGYDETLEFAKPKALFQNRIALLMDIPVGERQAAAMELFTEFDIPAAEHPVWLQPLLEV